jgi:aspartate/methionine/tyrosine aminotransferase
MTFPKSFSKKMLKLQQHINTNTNTFVQNGVLDSFEMDMSFLNGYINALTQRLALIDKYFLELPLSFVKPEGGFFVFVNIGELGLNSNEFCAKLIEASGVAVTPGIAFGKNWDDHIRISFAVAPDVLEKGLVKITEFVNSL